MTTKRNIISIFIIALLTSIKVYAEPWFTGPILAPAGKTIPAGDVNFEFYNFWTKNHGVYNKHGKLTPSPNSNTDQLLALLSYGFSEDFDTELGFPYLYNRTQGRHGQGMGDVTVVIGYQALRQKPGSFIPDLRATIQETLPSGNYDSQNPAFQGTDLTGKGSYQTALILNFQYIQLLFKEHYIRTRLSLGYQVPTRVIINGLSAYAGTQNTYGRVNPGTVATVDLAGELTLTKHWVAVMEGYFFSANKSTFRGNIGLNTRGLPGRVGYSYNNEFSLAPAIEYNFSGNVGIIVGYWYAIKGKSATRFSAPSAAINLYW